MELDVSLGSPLKVLELNIDSALCTLMYILTVLKQFLNFNSVTSNLQHSHMSAGIVMNAKPQLF